MDPVAILYGVVPPVVLALLGASLFGTRALGLAAGFGVLIAYALLKDELPGWPHELWHDANGTEWLLWAVLGAGLLSLLARSRWLPQRALPGIAALFGAFALLLVLSKVGANWSGATLALHVGGGALAIGALTFATQRTLRTAPPGMFAMVLPMVVLSLDAGIVTLGKSALLGQLCGAVAAAMGAVAGTRLWRKDVALAPADALLLAFAHAGFLLAGVHLAYLPWTPALLAGLAPLLLFAVPTTWWTARPRIAAMACAVLVVAPQLAAIALLLLESSPYGY